MWHLLSRAKSGCQRRASTHLDKFIPSSTDDHRILRIWAESHAGNPVGMTLVGDGELAVAECIPKLDCAIARARHNLTVVGRERHREDIVVVANKTAGGITGAELPKSQSMIPR